MKIIVSHDVDHLCRNDHYRDLVYPKLWIRSTLNLLKNKCTFDEWRLRMLSPFESQRHRIPELCEFDKTNDIPSTFFFGVNNGVGLSYSLDNAKQWVKYVKSKGFEVGVHGIAFDNYYQMKEEHEVFQAICGDLDFGIRMHYVRTTANTLQYLDNCGYKYDSSVFTGNSIKPKECYKVGKMIEFPVSVMDSYLVGNYEEMGMSTQKILLAAEKSSVRYFVILFHDIYFSDAYVNKKKWYINTIQNLKSRGYEFVSFNDAVDEVRGMNFNV